MCITTDKAELTKTKVYAGIATLDDQEVHVLCYANQVKSSKPNAMILPIPTQKIEQNNFIDTREFSGFLNSIALQSIRSDRRSRGFKSDSITLSYKSVQVFDSGSYTCIVADQASDISSVFQSLPEKKRPTIKQELLNFFSEKYPSDKWKFLCCCWEGNIIPEPIMLYYVPSESDVVYLPMLDSHDGTPPKDSIVKTDHTVMFGYHGDKDNIDISYMDLSAKVKSLIPTTSIGKNMPRVKNNGDLYVLSDDLKSFKFISNSSDTFNVGLTSFNVFPGKSPIDNHNINGE
jgi:hypothetical protein